MYVWHDALPWEEYISRGYVGSSGLQAWGTMHPHAWRDRYATYGGIKATRAMDAGSLLDHWMTSGDPVETRFARLPVGHDGRTKAGKDYIASLGGRIAIPDTTWREAEAALRVARMYVHDDMERQTSYSHTGLHVQCRPDFEEWSVGSDHTRIIDLKYTSNFDDFERRFRWTYAMQAGLYAWLSRGVFGSSPEVLYLVIEAGTMYPRHKLVRIPDHALSAFADQAEDRARQILSHDWDAVEQPNLVTLEWI